MISGANLELTVGEKSPFPRPGFGEMGVSLSIANGIMTLTVQLPKVTEQDLLNINSTLSRLAIYQCPDNQIGNILFCFGDGSDVWPLSAPLLGAESVLRAWADRPGDTNILLIVLVDSNTNEIKVLRTIGMPSDLFDIVGNGIAVTKAISIGSIMNHASRTDPQMIWERGIRWMPTEEHQWVRV